MGTMCIIAVSPEDLRRGHINLDAPGRLSQQADISRRRRRSPRRGGSTSLRIPSDRKGVVSDTGKDGEVGRRSNDAKALIAGPGDHGRSDVCVECDKPTVPLGGKRQQIDIRDLSGAYDLTPVGNFRAQEAHIVGPESMMAGGGRFA